MSSFFASAWGPSELLSGLSSHPVPVSRSVGVDDVLGLSGPPSGIQSVSVDGAGRWSRFLALRPSGELRKEVAQPYSRYTYVHTRIVRTPARPHRGRAITANAPPLRSASFGARPPSTPSRGVGAIGSFAHGSFLMFFAHASLSRPQPGVSYSPSFRVSRRPLSTAVGPANYNHAASPGHGAWLGVREAWGLFDR